MSRTVARNETLSVQLQDADGELDNENNWGYAGSYDETELKDWSFCNYSSGESCARISIVECGVKTYDPVTFKDGMINTDTLAFHLSTDTAVSAAQARNGIVFNVAKVDGSDAYKALMAQMQQNLKGDRSVYYALPYSRSRLSYYTGFPFSHITLYKAYSSRLYRYLTRPSSIQPPMNPIPIFEEILTAILNTSEHTLGTKVNTTSGYLAQDKIYMYITSPFLLIHAYTSALSCAMTHLDLRIYNHDHSLLISSYTKWSDHANDKQTTAVPKAPSLRSSRQDVTSP